ncbi:hypothetical protein AB6O49_02505 [Streptomyces sp. SBR177]
MNGIAAVLDALRRGEGRLTAELQAMVRLHPEEHEVRHVATELARWSAEHEGLLRQALEEYGPADGAPLPAGPDETGSVPDGTRLRLLADLRALHLAVTGNRVYWLMLAQAAAASRDARLTELTGRGLPRAERELRWTETMIKNLAAQALTAS